MACISVGFDAWRELERLNRDTIYRSYVCMQEVPGGPFITGDCYVFEAQSGRLVQATTGIKFQRLKKIVLDTVLGVTSPAAAGAGLSTGHARVEKASRMATSPAEIIVNTSHALLSSKLPGTPSTSASTPPAYPDMLKTVLGIVAAESGCSMEDLGDDSAPFADLGVDSLMAITVLAVVKRETGLDLDAGFFIVHDTIGAAKHALLERYGTRGMMLPLTPPPEEKKLGTSDEWAASVSVSASTPKPVVTELDLIQQAARQLVDSVATSPAPSQYISKIIPLQGPRTTDSAKLFLLADETGSALGYIPLPGLGPNLGVYGVESPFVKDPAAFDDSVTITQLGTAFAAAIRREQPRGPYLVGGMSAGTTLAVETARALLMDGETVSGLLLLDPADGELIEERLAARSTGLMKAGQKEHVRRMLHMLRGYRPAPLAVQPQNAVMVVTEQSLAKVDKDWKLLLPRLVVRQIDGLSGTLLRYPAVSDHCVDVHVKLSANEFCKLDAFGQSCKDAVAILRV